MKTEPDPKRRFFSLKQFLLLSGSPSIAVPRQKREAAFCFTKRSVHGQQ
ncbi:MAG: hypothetical protein JWO58_81 [Chitinophagaceae bacterium]|nr:hypothetical protein [Chitinophagaceae bacterium]